MADNKVQVRQSDRRRSVKAGQLVSHQVKCVVLGDGDVGKSAMLLTYLSGHYPEDCPPGPIDGHSEFDHLSSSPSKLQQGNVEVSLTFTDTYGQDEYEKLRERVCGSADVYMLCFDTSKRSTYERIRHHWVPEMRSYSSAQTPFVVVGLKTDIRSRAQTGDGDISQFVTYSEGMKEASELGASHYAECSAKNNTSVSRVFERAAHAAVNNNLPPELKRSSCVVS